VKNKKTSERIAHRNIMFFDNEYSVSTSAFLYKSVIEPQISTVYMLRIRKFYGNRKRMLYKAWKSITWVGDEVL
jgi:hypothetical protein